MKVLNNDKKFISKKDSPKSIELAREMNIEVSKWDDMEVVKNFYYEVNKKFNPEYVTLFSQVK